MLTVDFGKSTMRKAKVYDLYKPFKDGLDDVEDDECLERSWTSTTDYNVEQMKKMNLDNRRFILREGADDVGITFDSCQAFFMMFWSKFVRKLLNFNQKERLVDITQELLNVV